MSLEHTMIHAPVALSLQQRSDLGPVRLRTNGRRHRPNGLYFSVKSGRHLPHESRLELWDLWRAEVSCEVVSSWPQPFTVSFVLDGALRRYTPDRKDILANGRVEILEIKDDIGHPDPVYARKLETAASILDAHGMTLRVRRRAEIQAEPAFSAIEAIQRHRRTLVTASDVVRVQALLADGPRELAAAEELFPPGPGAFATLCALVVRRVIRIDLRDGLHPDATVERVLR